MTTQDQDSHLFETVDTEDLPEGAQSPIDAYGASVDEGVEGVPVFTVSGGDWNDLVDEATALHEERIVVNMGPQHPSTHGVLRLILELDGETVTEARAGIGYLHTGIEKNMEFRTWVQGVTFCTRMDYLTPMFQEAAYCLAVEKLLGITDLVPERATIIRVLMMELTRINSHLVCLGTGGMEMGATTVMTVGFRERERILRVFEAITGLRMNNAYIRPGGVAQDVPHGAVDMVREVVEELRRGIRRARAAAQREPPPQGTYGRHRLPRPHRVHGPGHDRTGAPRDRAAPRPAQVGALLRLRDLRLRRRHAHRGRRLRPAPHPHRRDVPVAADRRADPRPAPAHRGAAGHGRGQEDRLARRSSPSAATASATASTTSARSWAPRWRP